MQVQHGPRARRARGVQRARAERRREVVGAARPRAPVRRTAAATSSGSRPPRRSATAARARPSAAESRVEQLDVLAEVLAQQPREVVDRALLAAGHAVAVVQETGSRARQPNLWRRAGPRSSSRRAGRAAYLDVALASIAPQAARRGRRGRSSSTTAPTRRPRAVAERHGARYVAHAAAARAQRRAQHRRSTRPTPSCSCFVDDDVAVRPGWLAALLAAAAALPEDVGVLAGPIRARFEDHRVAPLRARGTADHRSSTSARATATPSTPGARTWRSAAARSSASGRFDERARPLRRRGGVAGAR